jgi:N-acetylglutamate synthase-like GNAT family acetyltransferase
MIYDSKTIGFGNLIMFRRIDWIGNIVVDPNYRNNGFGTIITQYLIDIGKNLGIKSFNLIATEIGKPIYKKLGFEQEIKYEFYKSSSAQEQLSMNDNIRKAKNTDLKMITDLDFLITGEDRRNLLENFISDTVMIFDNNNVLAGFYIESLGNGLIISNEEIFGIILLKKIIAKKNLIVITEKNIAARKTLLEHRFEKYLEAPRMILGEKYKWKPEGIFSRASGYLG